MTSTLAGSGQPAERIGLPQLPVERDVGRHVAVIFEIDAALVEDGAPPRCTCSARSPRRMAEGRVGEQGDARLVAEPARDAGRLDRDVGELLGVRHVVHGGVGDQHGAAARQHQRDADHAVAGLGIDARGARPRARPRNCA